MREFSIAVPLLWILVSGTFPVAAQSVSTDPVRAPSGAYEADMHGYTQMLFSIQHLGLTDHYWRFEGDDAHLINDAMFDQQKS